MLTACNKTYAIFLNNNLRCDQWDVINEICSLSDVILMYSLRCIPWDVYPDVFPEMYTLRCIPRDVYPDVFPEWCYIDVFPEWCITWCIPWVMLHWCIPWVMYNLMYSLKYIIKMCDTLNYMPRRYLINYYIIFNFNLQKFDVLS